MNIKTLNAQLPKIVCYDPLADFLGSFDGGVVEYDFDFMPVQKMATPDIFEALESFKNGGEIAYFQNAWSEKLHKIADIFETQNVIKIKSTNKM